MLIGKYQIKFYFKFPADGWIGYFWDSRQRNLYLGIPFMGLKITNTTKRPALAQPRPVKKKGKVSDRFYQVFCHAGTVVADCEFCGVTHFASGDGAVGYDEFELEKLRESASKTPEKYMEWDDASGLNIFHIGGRQGVAYCPCDGVFVYESFLWAYRFDIADYISGRSKAKLDKAKMQDEMISGLKATQDSPADLLD